MLSTYQAQATAIEELLRREQVTASTLSTLVDAVLDCSEQLFEWGDAEAASELIEEVLSKGELLSLRQIVRLQCQRLRVLALMHRDHECLEEARALQLAYTERQGECAEEYVFLRAIEGLALWHLNRTAEGIPKLLKIRE